MKENEFSPLGKFLVIAVIVIPSILSAIINIFRKHVPHPGAFIIVLIGFLFFIIAKLSVIIPKNKISFGTKLMSTGMANLYRLGYWLMVVGILFTFL